MADKIFQSLSYLRHFLTAKRKGHNVHSPFVYDLCENVFYNADQYYDFRFLSGVRDNLLSDNTSLHTEPFGAGSGIFKGNHRRVSDLVRYGTSTRQQSEILYRLCNFMKVRSCIELGTSVGLNTLYLARHNSRCNVFTIEGSSALSGFAANLAAQHQVQNITFVQGHFETKLPEIISLVQHPCLVYIDGDHSYEATVKYFRMLKPLCSSANILVFDDIYWSKEMNRAWKEIEADPLVRLSINCFRMGFIFFGESFRQKISERLLL